MVEIIGTDGRPQSDPEVQWYIDAVDEWRVGSEKPRYDPGWFHASQLGEDDATLIAQYRGVLAYRHRSARELRVFDNGKDRDESFKRYAKGAKLSVIADEESRRIRLPYLRLTGELDDIVHNPETGAWWLVENKTINPFGFGQLMDPMPAHVLQIMAYMGATQIDHGMVIYEAKGDQSWRGFYVPFNKDVWGGIVARLLRLRQEAEGQNAEMDPKVLDASLRFNKALAE